MWVRLDLPQRPRTESFDRVAMTATGGSLPEAVGERRRFEDQRR
jgi:hypothetical protein